MPLPPTSLSPPLQNHLTRRRFVNCLGLGGLTLTGVFAANLQAAVSPDGAEDDSPGAPIDAQGNPPRMVNGWLLSEGDV